jgi:hypothetical protein
VGLLINHKYKWAYIHIPKTGGTSITEILSQVDGTETIMSHGTINELGNIEDYFIFTFVRNPFTRLASWYDHIQRDTKSQSFSNFLKSIDTLDYLYFPQTYFTNHGKTDKKKISFVGKYENFSNDLNFVFKKLNINNTAIPHLNKNSMWEIHPNLNTQKLYKFYYNDGWMKEWVREKYKDDFKIFNYELDI